MKTLEDAREYIKLQINLNLWFMDKSLSSSEIEGFTDQIIFDLIKRFFAKEIDKKTLYKISGRVDCEEIEKSIQEQCSIQIIFAILQMKLLKANMGLSVS